LLYSNNKIKEKMIMDDTVVLYEVKENIAYITLNRPEKGNAVNPELAGALARTWDRFEDDPDARVAILRGNGKNFCAGLDLTTGVGGEKALSGVVPANGIKVFNPIIGLVHGWAVGVGYILACVGADITIAAETARFSFPEAKVGVMGNLSAPTSFILFKNMLEFHLTGEPVNAQKAREMGIVNKVVPEAELLAEGLKVAEILKGNAPLTLKAIKYGMYKSVHESASHAALETNIFVRPQYESQDMKEGARAFAERRKPRFTGK
jgi:enoyl-CoA hydratase